MPSNTLRPSLAPAIDCLGAQSLEIILDYFGWNITSSPTDIKRKDLERRKL